MTPKQDTQAELLLDSGMFTQVEHGWIVDDKNRRTFINKSRGVIATQTESTGDHTHFAFDKGADRYYNSGWYDADEIERYILPLMRDDTGWRRFCEHDCDIIEAMDYTTRQRNYRREQNTDA